ncbi:golgin subfamily A member 2-like [Tupaia chinensis]|uniref:golgin subfamily A member 2-like n=1 Tax=Tupaia chinensis TaxID=246437 RepID=UPI0003C8D817|nr:golgin subfamily A member 2-like [Tupaia chinensis]
MWSHPFPQPCLEMSEETRKKKLAAAKKKLREYQQKNCPGTLAAAKMKKKSKTGRTPKAITSGGCLSEDVPKDHTVPVPACADVTVLPDGVTSPGASTESPQRNHDADNGPDLMDKNQTLS